LVVAGDQVIIALPGGRMAALSLANGSLRWEAVVGEPKVRLNLSVLRMFQDFLRSLGVMFAPVLIRGGSVASI
jgi:hypothetical protein